MVIEKLKIRGFRGATQPVEIVFDPGKMIVLYGENGAGKSTIIDALDFVCNHGYGSLSERSGSEPRKYLAAIGTNPDDLRVHVQGGGREWVGRFVDGSIFVGLTESEEAADAPSAMILRRSQVQQLLNAAPNERYKAIRSYVDLSGVLQSEETLRDTIRQVQESFDLAALTKGQMDETLRTLWEALDAPGEAWDTWGVEQVTTDIGVLQRGVDDSHSALRATTTEDVSAATAVGLRLAKSQAALTQFQIIRPLVDAWQAQTAEAERLARTIQRLEALLGVVESERTAYVDQMLREISADVERMYAQMHPGEDIGQVQFHMDPDDPDALTFEGQFGTEVGIPPQAYYSEAHLDTLGICVFLALARSQSRRVQVIVLDDVMTSVDSSHLSRFLDMLEREIFPQQLILTTHYRKWQERYLGDGRRRVQLIQLAPWSMEYGVFLVQTKSALEQLRAQVHPGTFDAQVAASKGGILLEHILDFLTLHYGCKMPRQEMLNYTLGKLFSGIDNSRALLADLRVEEGSGENLKTTSLMPLIVAATRGDKIRNQVGCHFNAGAAEMHSRDVQQFVKDTLVLAEALVCAVCNELPSKKSDLFSVCRCGTKQGIRLFPIPPRP